MSLILVDTSVWIDFFRSEGASLQAGALQRLIEEENDICICPIIYQEVLQGIKEDKIFQEIKYILQNMIMIHTPIITVADHAVDLYRNLRKIGVTIRKPYDCLIAAYAMLENAYLLHNDSDFTRMENNCNLKIFHDENGKNG